MKKKRFSDPVIEITTADLNGDVGGSNFGGGDLNSIRPMPMSFDEWTQSTFCGDVDGSGGVDFADYTSWWNKNGFGEETWLAYNPELAVTDEVIDPVANVVGDELGG